jgi:hypothetical protein
LGITVLTAAIRYYIFITDKRSQKHFKVKTMKTFYRITSSETGTVLLKRRKIAKALRWWLRENGHAFNHIFFLG